MTLAEKTTLKLGDQNGTGRSHNCMGAGQGGRMRGRDRLYRKHCAFQGSVDGLCRCFLVSETLRHIFSILFIVLGELNAGQLRKAAIGYIDSVEEPKLLDLSELFIFPLKRGKTNKVIESVVFHGIKSDRYALFNTTVRMLQVKRAGPLVKLDQVYFFPECQQINILRIHFCQCWGIDKHSSSVKKQWKYLLGIH